MWPQPEGWKGGFREGSDTRTGREEVGPAQVIGNTRKGNLKAMNLGRELGHKAQGPWKPGN